MKIKKWGMVEAWIAHDPVSRLVVLGVGPHGFQVTVVDHSQGQQIEIVGAEEDPADAIFRAITKFK